ncbi:MAG: hypothetical protein PHI38_07095 [Sulfurimonas sp.]|uniref:hypothetical protein n=1 Tax=Sulfurimonas sp. TaxID=2022749 RepID=UPI002627B81A|nr:hypothetical protein [Sulfurimonas sp.]MDD3476619.1 hypothetical protein [Sulfurimonas sp.]
MKIYTLETKNGRLFKVAVANKSQENRLLKVVEKNKSKEYEVFTRVEAAANSIHNIKQFEELADSLV